MGAFCTCVMDKFRQEWAYDDYVQNFQLRNPTNPLPEVLGELMADYAQECTKKVVEHRTTGIPYAPDPDGKITTDIQTGKIKQGLYAPLVLFIQHFGFSIGLLYGFIRKP